MIKNLYARVCLRMGVKLYKNSKKLDLLIEYIIKKNKIPIKVDLYNIYFDEGHFWNSNKYYAWLHSGEFSVNGKKISWISEMPSPYMMLKFKRYLDQFNFEIIDSSDEAYLEKILKEVEYGKEDS